MDTEIDAIGKRVDRDPLQNFVILMYTQKLCIMTKQTYIEDITLVVISYEIIKRAFGEFDKFHMKWPRV